ncbi:MAG: DUF1501 domain-containing protein [Verrucomicrobiales bacterium]
MALHTRRDFLRTSVLGASLGWTIPAFLERTFFTLHAQAADSLTQGITGRDGPILVVIQLAGGNDGLNTLVPYGHDAYYRARPRLALGEDRLLKINDELAFNSRLEPFQDLYDQGLLSILQGVGYPNPNRSHFRSTEIWQTASDADRVINQGWLGRYFDAACSGEDPEVGLALTSTVPQSFHNESGKGLAVSRPESFGWNQASDPSMNEAFEALHHNDDEPMEGFSVADLASTHVESTNNLSFLQRTALDAQLSSAQIQSLAREGKNEVSYPNGNNLANQLSVVARLISGGLPTRVYYVSQGGYDTHNNQASSHDRLLQQLATATHAFVNDMKSQGNLDRVMVMTFSEFGRRVAENGNQGTDHGAAAPLFVAGGRVQPGLIGKHPDLEELHRGDLQFSTDFRSIYATILDQWLGANSSSILDQTFPHLPIIKPA